jgi:hypothetical protein
MVKGDSMLPTGGRWYQSRGALATRAGSDKVTRKSGLLTSGPVREKGTSGPTGATGVLSLARRKGGTGPKSLIG